jgi:hypothetical protein
MKKHLLLSPVMALAVVAAAVAALGACSSTTVKASGPPPCDPTQCAQRNECIADATGVSACRLPCTTHAECPFNYQCATNPAKNYCVKLTVEVVQKPSGQWGASCLPSKGEAGNEDCDSEGDFKCRAVGPTDALAYCTRFDCETDLECAGGFYCATINVGPNAVSSKRTFGKTRTACVRRDYCAPCNGDLDCPVIDGSQSRCTYDDLGESRYCATTCKSTDNCRLDASCTGAAEDGTKLCRPRAGTCKGDGSMCSPCRSDADCPEGYCLKAAYSPETFCSVKASSPCLPSASNAGKCPTFTGFAGTRIGCQSSSADSAIPKDQCIGVIEFADTGDIACYTKHPVIE